MSGLYRRALQIYRQTVGLRLVGKGEEGLDIEDVSPEDRDKILRQINEVIDRNRMKVQPDTFAITAKRSGVGLPLLINLLIAAVVVAAILTFSAMFKRQEDVLAAGGGTILSAESKLIESLRRESEEQMQEKDREILSFQQRLRQTQEQQKLLESQTEQTLQERERQLEEQYRAAVAAERQRLLDEGLEEGAIEDRLQSFQADRQQELEAEYEAFRRQTEQEAAKREAALAETVRQYESNLQSAQTERSQLERQAQERETEMRSQFEARTEALESERAQVAAQLASFQEQQHQEQLVRDQILGAYETVNSHISAGRYDLALEQLQSIRSYLNREPALSLAGIQRRRPVELFIINSLTELIHSREAEQRREQESLTAASNPISALEEGVDAGNRLLDQGDTAAAERRYRSALSQIPAALEGHERLSEIEENRRAEERQAVDSAVSQGQSLFQSEQYQASLNRYRDALAILLDDDAAAGRIVDQIGLISARLNPQTAGPQEPTQADQEQLRLIEQYRQRIAALERENSRLQADSDSSGAEKAELEARIEQLENERDRLAEAQRSSGGQAASRENLRERLAALESRYEAQRRSANLSAMTPPDTLANLLEAKLLTWQIIGSDPVATRYPQLYDTMERYLDTLTEQSQIQGRYAAVQDIITVLDALLGSGRGAAVPADLWRRYSFSDEQDLLARLMDKLELVLR